MYTLHTHEHVYLPLCINTRCRMVCMKALELVKTHITRDVNTQPGHQDADGGGVSYITINHTTYASDGSSRVEQIGFKQKECEKIKAREWAHRANPKLNPNISVMEQLVLKEHQAKTHSNVAFSRKTVRHSGMYVCT